MNCTESIMPDEVQELFDKLKKDAQASGYNLNTDEAFVTELIKGLIVNQKRYGYNSCPCRLSEGDKWKDMDIICPCDYRDLDVSEFGSCYCALYVSEAVARGEKKFEPVPERRFSSQEKKALSPLDSLGQKKNLAYPVWRCKVCGYLCAREQAPDTCPICKAANDRFEMFF